MQISKFNWRILYAYHSITTGWWLRLRFRLCPTSEYSQTQPLRVLLVPQNWCPQDLEDDQRPPTILCRQKHSQRAIPTLHPVSNWSTCLVTISPVLFYIGQSSFEPYICWLVDSSALSIKRLLKRPLIFHSWLLFKLCAELIHFWNPFSDTREPVTSGTTPTVTVR